MQRRRQFLRGAFALVAGAALVLGLPACGGTRNGELRIAGWKQLQPGESPVEFVLTIPSRPNAVYAVTSPGGIYKSFKSTDRGSSWTPIADDASEGLSLLAVDPSRPETLYGYRQFYDVVERPVGLAKSTDGGGTWRSANRGLPDGGVYKISIDPATPRTLYAAANVPTESMAPDANGIFKSTNGGRSWSRMWRSPRGNFVEALVIDPKRPSTLYAAASDQEATTRLFKSTNGGRSWRRIGLWTGGIILARIDVAIDPREPGTLYTVGDFAWEGPLSSGILKSTDGGARWIPVKFGLSRSISANAVAVDRSRGNAVYVAASDLGHDAYVLKSTNDGKTWSVVARLKPVQPGDAGVEFTSLAVDPTGRRVYAVTGGGSLFVCEACWKVKSPPARR